MGGPKPNRKGFFRTGCWAFALFLPASMEITTQSTWAQPPPADRDGEHDSGKRAQRALAMAEEAFDQAKKSYGAGEVKQGDGHLDDMTKLLNTCLSALEASRKAGLYKQAEIRVSALLRKLQALTDDLAVDDRGWAEYTLRQVDGIHDKLLSGVMKK
jgi:hypothetical protein